MEEFKWIKPCDDKQDKIIKHLEGRSLQDKFEIALSNNCIWLVEKLLLDGLNPGDYNLVKIKYLDSNSINYRNYRLDSNDCYFYITLKDEMINLLSKYFIII